MTDDAKLVLAGYTKLSQDDRKAVQEEIEKFERAEIGQMQSIQEDFEKTASIVLGPVGSKCPCCGR